MHKISRIRLLNARVYVQYSTEEEEEQEEEEDFRIDHMYCSERVYWFNDVVIFGSDCDRFSSDNKGTGNP